MEYHKFIQNLNNQSVRRILFEKSNVKLTDHIFQCDLCLSKAIQSLQAVSSKICTKIGAANLGRVGKLLEKNRLRAAYVIHIFCCARCSELIDFAQEAEIVAMISKLPLKMRVQCQHEYEEYLKKRGVLDDRTIQ